MLASQSILSWQSPHDFLLSFLLKLDLLWEGNMISCPQHSSYLSIRWGWRKEGSEVEAAQLCLTLWDPMDYAIHGNLQARILEWVAFPFSRGSSQPTQGLNPGLPHCRRILCQLSHKGSPRILGWVAYLFSSESSRPRNWTRFSWQVQCLLHCRWILYQLSYQGSPEGRREWKLILLSSLKKSGNNAIAFCAS